MIPFIIVLVLSLLDYFITIRIKTKHQIEMNALLFYKYHNPVHKNVGVILSVIFVLTCILINLFIDLSTSEIIQTVFYLFICLLFLFIICDLYFVQDKKLYKLMKKKYFYVVSLSLVLFVSLLILL